MTPPYHTQAGRRMPAMIATFVKTDHQNWDHELRHAMNTSVQSSIRVSPAFLNYRRQPAPVKSLRRVVEIKELKVRIYPEVWADRVKRLGALRDLVTKKIEKVHERQTNYYNKGRQDVRFQVEDTHIYGRVEHGSSLQNSHRIGKSPSRSLKLNPQMYMF